MKKFLSMALAAAMTLSAASVSVGAKDFADNSRIRYQEAVDVMSAAKVIDGYTDGSFKPQNTLTRGAAAKIICNLILGPTTASALSADTAPYKDVTADHTFAGYIAYCAQQGIISGYADGTFRPSAPLTGYAFMKMLLGALGYDSEVEGYTGSNWSINVAKQALAIELEDGNNSFVGTNAVTREEACLYAFNALKATMVDYSQKTEVTTGGSTVTISGSRYELSNATKTDGNIDKDGLMQFAEKYFADLETEEDADDFGRPASKWVYDGKTVGTYANHADEMYVVTDAAKTLKQLMTDGDYLDYDAKDILSGAAVYFNGAEKGTYSQNLNNAALAGKGDIIEVFENDDNDAETIVVRSYTYAKIDDVDDDLSKALKNQGASVGIDLVNIDEEDLGTWYDDHSDEEKVLNGFAADTYKDGAVLAVAFGADNAVIDSYVVESVVGTPSAARAVELYDYAGGKGVKNGTITVDGTKYTYAAQMTGLEEGVDVDFGEEYVVYLTAEGYVLALDGEAAASLNDVYYVVGVYGEMVRGELTPYAQVISVDDGVESTLLLDDEEDKSSDTYGLIDLIDTTSSGSNYTAVGGFYEFDEDGKKHEATKYNGSGTYDVIEGASLAADVTSGSTLLRLTGGTGSENVAPSRLYLDDDTFFIGAEDTGSALEISTATGVMTADKSTEGLKVHAIYKDDDAAFVIYAAKEIRGATNKSDVVYLTDDANTRADSETYMVDLVMMGDMSVQEDVRIDDDQNKQGFYVYNLTDGVYDLDVQKDNELDLNDEGEVDEDSDGYAVGVTFDETKKQAATSSDGKFVAVDFSNASVIDTRSAAEKKADIYSNDITSPARLAAAIDKGAVVVDVYVEDGEITFVAVVSCADESADSEDQEETPVSGMTVTVANGIITVENVGEAGVDAVASAIVEKLESLGYTNVEVQVSGAAVTGASAVKGAVRYTFRINGMDA